MTAPKVLPCNEVHLYRAWVRWRNGADGQIVVLATSRPEAKQRMSTMEADMDGGLKVNYGSVAKLGDVFLT